MTTNRRDFLTAAVTVAGAALTPDLPHPHDHEHQAVPSDLALRVRPSNLSSSKKVWSTALRWTH
jgi:hypothetical protein